VEPFRDEAELIAELLAARPQPRPDFAAELDERAAAGFPRRSAPAAALARLAARVRALPPRRLVLSGGAAALAAVAAVSVVVALGDSSKVEPHSESGLLSEVTPFPDGPREPVEAAPSNATEGAPSSGAASGIERTVAPGAPPTGPYASRSDHRDIERSAEMVLGTEAAGVGDAAAGVFDAVHAAGGIVLRSSVSGGADAGASFDLLIPSAKVSDALAAFSDIAEVRSRHEATADITAPTIRSGEQLRDSRARIESLLAQLSRAETESERKAAEAELRAERRHNAHLRSQLSSLQRRASFSRVSLEIESDGASSGAGGWGADDALGDAGHVLAIAAAVAIVGLAILAPISLVALLALLLNRTWVRRRREHVLG
jgi:hypothetical protein